MSRFSRINTIWRKELTDILRDRRTVLAMVLVPIVLYPVLMLGSLQAFEAQAGRLRQEKYVVAVNSEVTQRWLKRIIDTDGARRMMDQGLPATAPAPSSRPAADDPEEPASPTAETGDAGDQQERVRTDVRHKPPPLEIIIVRDVPRAVNAGHAHTGVILNGPSPIADGGASSEVLVVTDQAEIRSEIASAAVGGILSRLNYQLLWQRLQREQLPSTFVEPVKITDQRIATPRKMGGSILGQIVPLILIVMTISGAVYPAIDLTAGERERGTLETLVVAPVPTMDLIAGKFIVVTLIGMLSAFLNLLSIGGTIWLGGFGSLLSRGAAVQIPLDSLPLVLLILIPLAVMFSGTLLAVCSFARSFKEAQNYVMPVLVAAMIPAVVGSLPGTRLEGPILVIPVANIVVLTRELFLGRFDPQAILWVMSSTSVYAAAAVAVAAKLFGQEAVLFADAGSIRTVFQRRFFKPARVPSTAQALLMLAVVYPLNFFIQRAIGDSQAFQGNVRFFYALSAVLVGLFAFLPLATAVYTRIQISSAFSFRSASPAAWLAALCLGASTWILASAWLAVQQMWLPMDEAFVEQMEVLMGWIKDMPVLAIVFFMAVVPAVCEELFFRGYALSGVRSGMGRWGSILIIGIAFGVYHQSVHRLITTMALGMLFATLVLQSRSLWPAMLAHVMHNSILILTATVPDVHRTLVETGWVYGAAGVSVPPTGFVLAGAALLCLGLAMSALAARERRAAPAA
ncbi:MAG: CPBP family intramembrane metalloprotease [Phycisphaerales bacterium]|nr:CPBP family intramembrane metalloprotease [Phycisphaerales bacterium]